jgi:hypothetical protein
VSKSFQKYSIKKTIADVSFQQAVEERSALQTLNSQFQHKLAEYFKKKKVRATIYYKISFLFSAYLHL